MTIAALSRAETVARLNDRARLGFDRSARIVITRTCLASFSTGDSASAILAQAELLNAMRKHAFDNDAHGERDFGEFQVRERRVWFKIDYYDLALEYGSNDPSDASKTRRVITIMLPEDY